MNAFEFSEVSARLRNLSPAAQLAFGVAVCRRLLPSYEAFQRKNRWGDVDALWKILNSIAENISGTNVVPLNVKLLLSRCDQLIPDSEDFDDLYVSAAMDAGSAVVYLLEYVLKADADHIATVAQLATDSVDLYVQEIVGMDPQDIDLERKILGHPLMQRELLTQDEQLRILERTDTSFEEKQRSLEASWQNGGRSNLDLP